MCRGHCLSDIGERYIYQLQWEVPLVNPGKSLKVQTLLIILECGEVQVERLFYLCNWLPAKYFDRSIQIHAIKPTNSWLLVEKILLALSQ